MVPGDGSLLYGSHVDRHIYHRMQAAQATLREIFQVVSIKFVSLKFIGSLTSHWNFLLSFGIGSLVLCLLLGMMAYPLSLLVIQLYRARKNYKLFQQMEICRQRAIRETRGRWTFFNSLRRLDTSLL